MWILDPDDLSGLSQRQIPNQFLTSQSNDDEPVDPTLSPSGLKIAYSDSGWIWTINVYEGSGRRRITNLDDCYQSSWSPDSSRIAFRKTKSSLDVHAGIWIINADGTGLTSFSGSAYARSPAWSPDGSAIVYADGTGRTMYLRSLLVGRTVTWTRGRGHTVGLVA